MRSLDKVAETYRDLADGYDESQSIDQTSDHMRLFLRMYENLTWRYIEPYLPADLDQPILDAGGGTGKWAIRIAEKGHRDVRILDLSEAMLGRATERFERAGLEAVLTVRQGDIRALPWPKETFGLVLSEADAVGYCLDEWETALRELVRVCRAGGLTIVSADDLLASYWGSFLMEGIEAANAVRETRKSVCPYGLPIRCFSPAELERAFDAAGASLIKTITKPALAYSTPPAIQSRMLEDTDLQSFVLDAEAWACEEGYVPAGSHIHAVARKRARNLEKGA